MPWGVIVGAVLLALLWNYSDSLPLTSEVTVYLGWCPDARVNGECRKGEEAGNPTVYKAMADQQVVVYWTGKNPPAKLEHCSVRNARNWSCTLADWTRSMVDGEYSETSNPLNLYYPVPKYKWYWLDWNTNKN